MFSLVIAHSWLQLEDKWESPMEKIVTKLRKGSFDGELVSEWLHWKTVYWYVKAKTMI